MDETKVTASPAATATATTPTKHVATLGELKAAFPNSDADFREQCIEASATIEQARERWQAKREAELEAREKTIAAKEKELNAKAATKPTKPGVEAAPTGSTSDVDANGGDANQFEAVIQSNIAKGMDRGRAVSAAAKSHPEAHRAYVIAANSGKGRTLGRFE